MPIKSSDKTLLVLGDMYITKILIRGITYPSIRAAVLSFKTCDMEQKQTIAKALLPADLKEIEELLPNPDYWKPFYIGKLFTLCTKIRCKEDTAFGKVLLDPEHEFLTEDFVINGQSVGNWQINEVKELPNFFAQVLMDVRTSLL